MGKTGMSRATAQRRKGRRGNFFSWDKQYSFSVCVVAPLREAS
jgi:hypothetical protein